MMRVKRRRQSSLGKITAMVALWVMLLVMAGCQSCKKSADEQQEAGQAESAAGAPSHEEKKTNDSVENWNDLPLKKFPKAPYPYRHSFALPAPQPPPVNPDEVIDRYSNDCASNKDSASCQELRRQVEIIFLDDLVALRGAGQKIDRKWYRVAASADTPQLACIGLRELIFDKERTAEDEAMIAAAIDSPSLEVRDTVLSLEATLPAVKDAKARWQGARYGYSGTCAGGRVDSLPGLKWAGGYPGARFRYFASGPSLRWFTTNDPVEKVLAYFNNSGRKALTAEELAAAASAKLVEEMNKISEAPDPGDEEKLMELIMGQTTQTDWSAPFRNLQDVGEVRYVMLSAKQAIAIFRDDALHATSIVAPRPAAPVNLDMEKAKKDALTRSILQF